MKTLHNNYCNSKQGYLPLFLSDCLDLLDPVLTFDRLMGGIDLNKYLTDIPEYTTGRLRYNPVNMLKTVLFGFMTSGYCSLRELEDNCKVNIRFMYLMEHQTPSYRTFGYFINEILQDKIENIFNDINLMDSIPNILWQMLDMAHTTIIFSVNRTELKSI